MGTLFLVATPIGNLEDVTLRALRVLREVTLIAMEDTRHTRKLLQRHQINTPFVSYHEHNKEARKAQLLAALAAGDVALVSDAGTPGLSDPGYELVLAAIEAGYVVSPIPGPSAPVAALVASGMPSDSFVFLGYLPRRANERRRLLQARGEERRTLIVFEAPHRLRVTLKDMQDILGEGRPVAVCRELTKVHEEILRGTLGEVRQHFEDNEPRGEFTLVVAGKPETQRWDEASVRKALAECLGEGLTLSESARRVAARCGWARAEVYRLSLREG